MTDSEIVTMNRLDQSAAIVTVVLCVLTAVAAILDPESRSAGITALIGVALTYQFISLNRKLTTILHRQRKRATSVSKESL